MPDAFVVSCLGDRFRGLSGPDDALKTNSGRLSFSNRLFKGLSRCLRSCLLPIASHCCTSQIHGANVLHIEQYKRSIWILTVISIAKSSARSEVGEPSTGTETFDGSNVLPFVFRQYFPA